jgi:hypothetical protein
MREDGHIWLVDKDLEGSSHGLFEGIILAFTSRV